MSVDKIARCTLELKLKSGDISSRFQSVIKNFNASIAMYNDVLHVWHIGSVRQRDSWIWSEISVEFGMVFTNGVSIPCGNSHFHSRGKDVDERAAATCGGTTSHFSVLSGRSTGPSKSWMRVKMVRTLHIVLKGEVKQLIGIVLWKRSMQIRISVIDTLLAMIVILPPLSKTTQKYRVENLIRDTWCVVWYEIRSTSGSRWYPRPLRKKMRTHP